jgi:uronate dehydrogenase
MLSCKRVLITGATGIVGENLRRHLLRRGRYELRLIALDPEGDPDVSYGDLRLYDSAWRGMFEGVDAVVHLASAPVSTTSWDDSLIGNFDIILNVYSAAAEHRVKRVVFASSVWTMYGYRFQDTKCSPTLPANPGVSPYGMLKIFGERVGKAFFDSHGISTVALRIGACGPGDDIPAPHMATSAWDQDCWLSYRDMSNGIERAILAEDISFGFFNLTSRNTSARWSLSETDAAIGYQPLDSRSTRVNFRRRLQGLVARTFFFWVPAFSKRFVAPFW